MTEAARFVAIMEDGAALRRRLAVGALRPVLEAVDACEAAMPAVRTLFFRGTGGSAADARHLGAEWLARLRSKIERLYWPAIALTLDPAAMTAGGNDDGFEEVFARPLSGLGRRGDVPVGITTSGPSANVLRAFETGRVRGAHIALGHAIPEPLEDRMVRA